MQDILPANGAGEEEEAVIGVGKKTVINPIQLLKDMDLTRSNKEESVILMTILGSEESEGLLDQQKKTSQKSMVTTHQLPIP